MHDSTRKTNFHKRSDKLIRSEVPAELKPIFKEAFGNVDYAFSKPHDEREVILATAADHRASGDRETDAAELSNEYYPAKIGFGNQRAPSRLGYSREQAL